MIVRGPRASTDFTVVSNAVIRDHRLSYRARGILISILSRPDDWRTDYKSLARDGREGESAVRAALAELRDAGYIVHTRVQGERGRWLTVSTVYDVPQDPENSEDAASVQVAPSVGKPKSGGPKPGEPTPIPRTETKNRYEVGSAEADRGSRDHGLASASTLRVEREEVTRIKPERKRRKLTRQQRHESWLRFLDMDLGDLDTGREIRGSAFMELEQMHGAIDPAAWAAAMIEQGEWPGFVASFDLGHNLDVTWSRVS